MQRARITRHPWLVACDANISPVDFEKGLWFRKDRMHLPEKASPCRSKSAKGEWVEKVYDSLIACDSLKRKISQMKVVEGFESRPHKSSSFCGGKEIQEWNEQKLPKVLLAIVEEGCLEEHKRKRRRRMGARRGQRGKKN